MLLKLTLARAFAYYEGIKARFGVESKGPSYVDKAVIRARRAQKKRRAAARVSG